MALYLYDLEKAADMAAELAEARACKNLLVRGVSWKDFRTTLAMLVHHRTVVMPNGLHHHTRIIENLKAIALLIPGTVTHPLCVYRGLCTKHPSAAAVAAPPTQQRAVVDGPIVATA